MKNKIKYLLVLLILLVPSFVLAKDTCNDNDIKIKSISLKELNGFSEEVQESSVNNNTINLNLKMYDVGDSSTYYITVENTSSEDYYFTKDSMKLENDYLEYSLKNDSEVIPAKNEKTIELKVSYKNKVPNDSYSDTSKLIISLSNKPLNNPETKMNYTFIFIIIILIAITIYTKINKKSLSKKKLLLVLTLLSIIPINTTALCTVNLNVETKIEIENKEAIFLTGSEVSIKMKELAGTDTSADGVRTRNSNIISIKQFESEPMDTEKQEKNIVSTSDSPYPIYMWYEEGTIYWWSEDKHPSLNSTASFMFSYLLSLENIDTLKDFDISNTTVLNSFFYYDHLTNLDAIKNWNTSNVESISWFVGYNKYLVNIDGIKNWDMSNVMALAGFFESCFSLEEIDISAWKTTDKLLYTLEMFAMSDDNGRADMQGILKRIILSENFDTSHVVDMGFMFANNDEIEDYSFLKYLDTSNVNNMYCILQNNYNFNDTQYLKDWNVSKVKNMSYMFFDNKKLESLEGIRNWDVSNVTTTYGMFYGCNQLASLNYLINWDLSNNEKFGYMFGMCNTLTDLSGLENWNTSSANDMNDMFISCKSLVSIQAIQNWNVKNVTNFNYMFNACSKIEDSESISEWNISHNATFTYMFRNVPTHPEFTKVPGTWNSSGTFIPST